MDSPTGYKKRYNTENKVMIENNDNKLEEPSNNKTVTVGPSPTPFTQSDYKALFGLLQKMNLQNTSTEADHSVNQIHVARERGDGHTTNSGTEGIFFFFLHSKSIIFIINKGQY